MEHKFKISSKYKPAGDQPKAIEQLVEGVKKSENNNPDFQQIRNYSE